jgi:threonyl-tRNA synthetase
MNQNQPNLEHIRHSLAHLMAAAVIRLYPDAQLTLGPAIDDGFYYDIHFPTTKPTESDLPGIESTMREILPTWHEFTRMEVSAEEARTLFAGNVFKLELIDGIIERGEEITLYKSGDFVDLCRGGHVSDMAQDVDPECFKLHRASGAYWRGDEKNPMLTRIYGLAFASAADLASELWRREEAQKRDHKKLGKELDIFVFSELVGGGLPLWTPRGTILRNLLDDFVWDLRKKFGYVKVEIPHITKKELYETSGHWEKYKDDLFHIHTREGHEFVMKPMNCPHHTQIYNRRQWSYRELPQRYANTTACYRDEQSGELSGLERVRGFCQDDAHVFCRLAQFQQEAENVWDIITAFYGSFGMVLRVRLSKHDPEHPEKYLGSKERWEYAEEILEKIAAKKGVGMEVFDGVGEAAFYGPKIDFMAKDSMGRETQVATIQLDQNMPERFDLTCVNENSEKERIVMIHAAIMGSIERFMSVLIEHFAGAFPVWLSPTQVVVLPISGDKHGEYAQQVALSLLDHNIRAEVIQEGTLGGRIRNAKNMKVPYQIVVGDSERDSNTITVEGRNELKLSAIQLPEFIDRVLGEIKNRADL